MDDLSDQENQAQHEGEQEQPIPQTGAAALGQPGMEHDKERKPDSKTKTSEEAKPRKPAQSIMKEQISSGLEELERPATGLLMSGLSAGMDLGFSIFLMGTMMTLTRDVLPHPVSEMLVAAAYSVGFILVILGKSELFTEHTTTAVVPVLNREAGLGQLLRLWVLVLVSNLVGGAIFAGLAVIVGQSMGVIKPESFGEIARGVVNHPSGVILLSAVLAGWLMGLLAWLVTASRDTIGQIAVILIITFTIGVTHLHHVVAGNIEVLTGIFAGQGITGADYLRFLVFTVIGNSIGGIVFVALVKFAHVVQGKPENKV